MEDTLRGKRGSNQGSPNYWTIGTDDFFLFVTCTYTVDVMVRLYGLGIRSFRANGWNIFDVITVTGSFATTIPLRAGSTGFATEQAQKLFLVIMLLIQLHLPM